MKLAPENHTKQVVSSYITRVIRIRYYVIQYNKISGKTQQLQE